MPVNKTSKRSKKRVKTRRVRAGAPKKIIPKELNVEQSNIELGKLLDTSIFDKINISIVSRLSPRATADDKYLLETFATVWVDETTDENILLDVINKTVALSDLNTFLNENNVDDIIESLIYYGSKFNRSMVLILQSMPPIRNENTLDRLYELAIDYVNPTVLEALRNAGHVPLTNDQLEALKATLPENDDRETRQHVNRFIAIFNTIKPAAETETSYLIHSLEKYNNTRSLTPENIKYMRLNQDNIEDIYSHLKAIANDESTNKSDDDGVAAEAAGY